LPLQPMPAKNIDPTTSKTGSNRNLYGDIMNAV
jgi:hypothetical protein